MNIRIDPLSAPAFISRISYPYSSRKPRLGTISKSVLQKRLSRYVAETAEYSGCEKRRWINDINDSVSWKKKHIIEHGLIFMEVGWNLNFFRLVFSYLMHTVLYFNIST